MCKHSTDIDYWTNKGSKVQILVQQVLSRNCVYLIGCTEQREKMQTKKPLIWRCIFKQLRPDCNKNCSDFFLNNDLYDIITLYRHRDFVHVFSIPSVSSTCYLYNHIVWLIFYILSDCSRTIFTTFFLISNIAFIGCYNCKRSPLSMTLNLHY